MYDNTLTCLCIECILCFQLKWLFAMYTYWLGGLIRWDQSGDNHLYLIQQEEDVNEEDVKLFTPINWLWKSPWPENKRGMDNEQYDKTADADS